MKSRIILLLLVHISTLTWSQIRLHNKEVIDSIIKSNMLEGFEFQLDKEKSSIAFFDVSKEDTPTPTIESNLVDKIKLDSIVKNHRNYVYRIIYYYKFIYQGHVFCERDIASTHLSIISEVVKDINAIYSKIKSGKFISPQKAEMIAKSKGIDKIEYQSISDNYFGLKGKKLTRIKKDVWILKGIIGGRLTSMVINAKNGKTITFIRNG